MAEPVVVVDYDPSWPATFEQLRSRLAATLGPLAARLGHDRVAYTEAKSAFVERVLGGR